VRFWDASVAVAYGKAEHELGNDHMAIPALGGAQAELWLVTQRAHDPSLVEQANAVLESLKNSPKISRRHTAAARGAPFANAIRPLYSKSEVPEGASVLIQRSKNDQEGAGRAAWRPVRLEPRHLPGARAAGVDRAARRCSGPRAVLRWPQPAFAHSQTGERLCGRAVGRAPMRGGWACRRLLRQFDARRVRDDGRGERRRCVGNLESDPAQVTPHGEAMFAARDHLEVERRVPGRALKLRLAVRSWLRDVWDWLRNGRSRRRLWKLTKLAWETFSGFLTGFAAVAASVIGLLAGAYFISLLYERFTERAIEIIPITVTDDLRISTSEAIRPRLLVIDYATR
jgi:hypothetical protein